MDAYLIAAPALPGPMRMPAHAEPVTPACGAIVTRWANEPFTASDPFTISSIRAASKPDAWSSVLRTTTFTPASIVKVAPGGTTTSPVRT
jgi:hypothetical protein